MMSVFEVASAGVVVLLVLYVIGVFRKWNPRDMGFCTAGMVLCNVVQFITIPESYSTPAWMYGVLAVMWCYVTYTFYEKINKS